MNPFERINILTLTHVVRSSAGRYYRPQGFSYTTQAPLDRAYLMTEDDAYATVRNVCSTSGRPLVVVAACDLQ